MVDTQARPAAQGANLPAVIPDPILVAPNLMPSPERSAVIIETLVSKGNLEALSPGQRARYYVAVCQSLGLNAMTRPFDFLTLDGKLVMYPNRGCADQLARAHNVSHGRPDRKVVTSDKPDESYVEVEIEATLPGGRSTWELAVVPLWVAAQPAKSGTSKAGRAYNIPAREAHRLSGVDLANALMKCITKAKRRATLSIVGLGWVDVDRGSDVRDAEPVYVDRHGNAALAPPERPIPHSTASNEEIFGEGPTTVQARQQPPADEPEDDDGATFSDEDEEAFQAAIAETDAAETRQPGAPPASAGTRGATGATAGPAGTTAPQAQAEPDDSIPDPWEALKRDGPKPPWAGTPEGDEVLALYTQLTAAGKKVTLPAEDAAPSELAGWLSSKRSLLPKST